MNTDEDKEREADLVRAAVRQLSEHFETVQIFVSRHSPEDDGAVSFRYGVGNFYARYGQVSEWLSEQEEGLREKVRRSFEG